MRSCVSGCFASGKLRCNRRGAGSRHKANSAHCHRRSAREMGERGHGVMVRKPYVQTNLFTCVRNSLEHKLVENTVRNSKGTWGDGVAGQGWWFGHHVRACLCALGLKSLGYFCADPIAQTTSGVRCAMFHSPAATSRREKKLLVLLGFACHLKICGRAVSCATVTCMCCHVADRPCSCQPRRCYSQHTWHRPLVAVFRRLRSGRDPARNTIACAENSSARVARQFRTLPHIPITSHLDIGRYRCDIS